jgi:hypothetical protein
MLNGEVAAIRVGHGNDCVFSESHDASIIIAFDSSCFLLAYSAADFSPIDKKSMDVKEFETADTDIWDSFVERSFNGTLMHQRRLLNYHPADRFQDRSVLIRDDKGGVIAIFPAAEVDDHGRRILKSHPGASYGGFVVREDFAMVAHQIVELLVQHARTHRFDAVWLRSPERVFNSHPSDDLDSAMYRAGFQLIGRELSTAFCLRSLGEHEILTRFNPNARRNVLKAQREGVIARITEDFSDYWDLLQANLESRHAVHPTHTLDEIERLRKVFGDRVLLVGGYLNDRLVAGVVLFMMNRFAAHTMYIGQDYRFNKHRALQLVIYQALLECRTRGLPYLNYGISTIPGTLGRQLNGGLHAFKLRSGGEAVFRDIWQLEL